MNTQLVPLLSDLIRRQAPGLEGTRPTGLPGVRVFRVTRHLPRCPLVYSPGLVIVGQGHKVGHLNGRTFTYGQGTYLILSVPMPFECETFASVESPLMGVFVDVDAARVQRLLDAMPASERTMNHTEGLHCGIEPAQLDATMVEVTCRLVRCLQDPCDTQVLGDRIVDELAYRALQGPQGHALVSLTQQTSAFARVARALNHVHQHYAQPMTVDELASHASMSTSSFFRAFKEITEDTPLQYIKKIRLDRAHTLLSQAGASVSTVAYEVGYQSPAQFSREFKRHFSTAPSEVKRTPRGQLTAPPTA